MSSIGINQSVLKDGHNASFDLIHNRIESLSTKMDTLINIQEKVLNRLDSMESTESKAEEESDAAPKAVDELVGREVRDICQELSTIMSEVNQRSEQQAQKLEGMEKLVLSMQQVISFIGETVKSSRVMQLMLKGNTARKGAKVKDNKGKVVKKKTSTDALTKKADAKVYAIYAFNNIINFYTINWQEVLGGGRFGQVHKCVENSSGLTLAAKVIKARGQKEKAVVKNEIQVMNNLDHANLIQLYAAYESRNDIILVLEYVGGGELFDRIIDENYKLTELDAVVFIRQICDGLQHMHKMYILHLDLKPENILCVSRVTNKIKIIDFGLARIYKPSEKLQVNFGTPEFLAPEVVNYEFVSFNTDMWSLGVITYMLLSGLCPFLGDNDNETLNNILACKWNFEEQEFSTTSDQAKDFISRLLIVNKSWRMTAGEALRHPWLSDPVLHHSLHAKVWND
uniref:Myosin light chain kinase family, member 4a n=1 Tax=Neogobius melanostomus TaxID=47308 RepID=A0A8C6UX60_9GOBI